MNLPHRFKFKSTVKGMTDTLYEAIKVENNYVIIWRFMGNDYDMIMSVENMDFHFRKNEYELSSTIRL